MRQVLSPFLWVSLDVFYEIGASVIFVGLIKWWDLAQLLDRLPLCSIQPRDLALPPLEYLLLLLPVLD